jgi:hypothetical protein
MDVASAQIITLYWATSIILHSIMGTVTRPAIWRSDIKYYCRRIIRTALILFHPAVGAFRTHLATFPMTVAITHLSVFEPKERDAEQQLLGNCFMKPEGATIGLFLKAWRLMPGNISPRAKGFMN